MKKLGLLAMLGILGISACTGVSEIETEEETIVKKEVTITATHEFDYQTKTVLQEDGSVWWKPNDAIGVFFGTYCSWFTAYNMEDSPTANFIGEALIIQGHNENSNGNAGEYTYWGVFPPDLYNDYDDDNFSYWSGNEDYEEPTREKESVNVYLPAKQKGVAGTFDSNLFISIAKSNTYKELSFYNLCGGLAFCVEKEGIHTVTFKGNADEVLAGGVNVVMNSDNHPVVNEVRNGKTEVKLTMPEGDYFVPGEWYYMVMLPTALEEGYSMTFYTDGEMGTVVSSNPVEVKRSVFGKLTNPDSDVEYTEFVPAKYVEIEYESDSHFNIGETLALTAVITPEDCTFPAVWSSSDPSVATVDENGNVVGVSEGEARITLTVGDVSEYIYVYVSEGDEKVPSFTITSIDLTDVYAIRGMYDDYRGGYTLHAVSDAGTQSPLKFQIESDDKDFEEFVMNNVKLAASYVELLTEKYLMIKFIRFHFDYENTPEVYREALVRASDELWSIAIRLSDDVMLEMPDDIDISEVNSLEYQAAYYTSRESYDGQYIYQKGIAKDAFLVIWEESGNLMAEEIHRFEGSDFRPNYERILLDKDNNILTYEDGIGYVLCSDKSIIPFTLPLPEADYIDIELAGFFEANHTWYCWLGTHHEWEDFYHYARLFKVTLEDKRVVYTELYSAFRAEYWTFDSSYYRRGNMFIWGRDGNYVVIDVDKVDVSYVSVEQHGYAEHITPDGYYYSMENNVLYKYDLLSGEPTVIPTDRSQVPPMTPTTPHYDATNHCYYESGTRLSDSATITVVTDAETGKVVVYEGSYESSDRNMYVKLP